MRFLAVALFAVVVFVFSFAVGVAIVAGQL